MRTRLTKKQIQQVRDWFSEDDFCVSIHMSPSRYSQEIILEAMSKFVKGRLNKYLMGQSYWKKWSEDNGKLIHICWFKEGVDIRNSHTSGYHNQRVTVHPKFKMKQSEVESHYHFLVRRPQRLKNTEYAGLNFGTDYSSLIEVTLKRIFREFNWREDFSMKFDVVIKNANDYDKSQQQYVTKQFGINDFEDSWGIL